VTASSPTIFQAAQRAQSYWFADGLAHILYGAVVVLFGICNFYLRPRYRTPWTLALSTAFFLLFTIVLFYQREIVERLKAKITYPRTGYARTPFPESPPGVETLTTLSRQDSRPAMFQYQVRNLAGVLFGDLNARTLSMGRPETNRELRGCRLPARSDK
jgi:hypothetical protein